MNKLFLLIILSVALVLAWNYGAKTPIFNKNTANSDSYKNNFGLEKSNSRFVPLKQKASPTPDLGLEAAEESSEIFNSALESLQNELTASQKEIQQKTVEVGELPSNQLAEIDVIGEDDSSQDNSDNPYFELTPEEVRELNNSGRGNNSGLIPGVHSKRGGGGAAGIPANPVAEEDTPADVFQKLPILTGQHRGYVMLYLMHPRARETVNAQVEALVVSGIRNLYLSVLVDGTFGKDYDFLKNTIKKLSDNADSLTLALYLSNGSTMRRWDRTDILAGFNGINPAVFRDLIQTEERAKNEFRTIVQEAEQMFDYNRSLRAANQNIAIVMLEDNLQRDSYIAMRNQAKAILGNKVTYIRNPCPGCFPGNDTETDGDAIELHDPTNVNTIDAGDGFTNDGSSYRLSSEAVTANSISLTDLQNQMLVADRLGARYFGLWRQERQGYNVTAPLHPDLRVYEVPTVSQLVEEIKMLRTGLKEIS